MLKINVNETDTYEVRPEQDGWLLNGTLFDGDVVALDANRYHVIWNDRSFSVEVVETDRTAKTCTLRINGHLYTTSARDRFDLLLESMGMNQGGAARVNQVKAPMPGLIQSVGCAVGDVVPKGSTLLVLVAMKMENTIKSPGEGKVKAIRIKPGDSVEKNQVLVEFE
jgi:biotin carboxyl carrier protein